MGKNNTNTNFQTEYVKFEQFLYCCFVWINNPKKSDSKYIPVIMPYLHKSELSLLEKTTKQMEAKGVSRLILKSLIAVVKITYKTTSLRILQAFMKGSDLNVDEKCKNAALYTRVDSYGFNLKTGEKIKNGISFWEN